MPESSRISKRIIVMLILIIFISTIMPQGFSGKTLQTYQSTEATQSTVLRAALQWLEHNQSSDGSYLGKYFEHFTAVAAYALWLNNTGSTKTRLSYAWLANSIDDSSAWYWGSYGEADIPGMILYSLGATQNTRLIHTSSVSTNLLQLHDPSGGFTGYNSASSSVDTALAIRGLIITNAINASIQESAVNYLFTFQNPDGSFNLTQTKAYDSIYYQGPGPISITALVLLALKDASVNKTDSHVSKGLNFLAKVSERNFPASIDNATTLGASLSVLAFNAFDRSNNTSNALSWLVSHPDNSGGFTRGPSSAKPDAYDTAWATIALEQPQAPQQQAQPTPTVQPQFTNIEIVAAALGVLLIVLGVFFVLRRRTATVKKSSV